MELIHKGKVRDVYSDRSGELILVATDRVSVYDVVLPTTIPGKGMLLNKMSAWWFDQFADVPNHVVSTEDVPQEWAGRAMRCRKVKIVPVECIVRGYLAGSGWRAYKREGRIADVQLPEGLLESAKLPEPIFTPTTKVPPEEGHDEPMTFADVVDVVGEETADKLRDLSLQLYARAAAIAEERGAILVDTKFEFGFAPDGELLLADELFTPDSSRYWKLEEWVEGRSTPAWDKEYVREYAASQDWDKTPPGPELPPHVVAETRRRYVQIYERVTGSTPLSVVSWQEIEAMRLADVQELQAWGRRVRDAKEAGLELDAVDAQRLKVIQASPFRYASDRAWSRDEY